MTMPGICVGGPIRLVERRGEQVIAHDGLVLAMSMDPAQAGTHGEMAITAIDAVFVNEAMARRVIAQVEHSRTDWHLRGHIDLYQALVVVSDVVHTSHRDWVERRAGIAYEEAADPRRPVWTIAEGRRL